MENYDKFPVWKIEAGRLQKYELVNEDGKIRHRAVPTVSNLEMLSELSRFELKCKKWFLTCSIRSHIRTKMLCSIFFRLFTFPSSNSTEARFTFHPIQV